MFGTGELGRREIGAREIEEKFCTFLQFGRKNK
jgi:hypothetical protein